MVRHCAVQGCNSTDLSILCHRFPKRKDAFEQWQRSLQLGNAETALLMQRFVVCTLHFKSSDYRNLSSRMLNTVAIPSLSYNNKSAFYDAPTSAVGTGSCGAAGNSSVGTSSNSAKEPIEVILKTAEPSSSDEQERTLISSSLVIERVDPLETMVEDESEDMIYFIEEGIPPEESAEVRSNVKIQSRASSPAEASNAKRFKLESCEIITTLKEQQEPESKPLTVIQIPRLSVEYQNSSVQTDDIEIVSHEDQLQRRMVDECYPEYSSYSRLELAKQLKEKDERLAELTKKLTNFETAHSAMLKTMEAFKTLVN